MPADHEWDATDQAKERTRQMNPPNRTDAENLVEFRAQLARGGLTAGERATVQARIDAIEAKVPTPSNAERLAELRASLAAGNCTTAQRAAINAEINTIETRYPASPTDPRVLDPQHRKHSNQVNANPGDTNKP